MYLLALASFIVCLWACAVVAQPHPQRTAVRQAVDIQVPHAPASVRIRDKPLWVYEVHITSFARTPLRLTHIQIFAQNRSLVESLTGEALARATSIMGAPANEQSLTIQPGRRAVVYLSVPTGRFAPEMLTHGITLVSEDAPNEEILVAGGEVSLSLTPPPALSPPLRGGPWTAVYAPEMERGHRRVIYAVEGKARIPGRHAIDWMVPVTSPGALANPYANTDGYGAPILAVADGRVIAVQDGVPEPPQGQPRPPVKLENAPGNFIALDIGQGRYAFYEHLAPGLRVRLGQRVRRGEVIAQVGSTGQASRPHLHFHVSDEPAPVAAEGQPFEMLGWRQVGSYSSIQAFDRGDSWQTRTAEPAPQGPSVPSPMSVVVFE